MDYFKTENYSIEWEKFSSYDDDEISEKLSLKIVTNIIMSAIFITGVPLNFMICVIIAKQKTSKSPLSLILASLAIADLFVIFTFGVIILAHEIYDEWIFGSVICTFEIFSIFVSQSFEAIMLSIAFVVFSCELKIRKRNVWTIIIILLMLSSMMAFSRGFYAKIADYNGRFICAVDFDANRKSIVIAQLVKLFLPWTSLIIIFVIKTSEKITQSSYFRTKINRICFLLLVVYILLSSPYAVVKTLLDLKINVSYVSMIVTQSLSLITLIYKPVIYLFMSDNFKKSIVDSHK